MFVAKQRPLLPPTPLERRLSKALGRRRPVPWHEAVEALRRTMVRDALARNASEDGWNVAAAAREIDMTRHTLYKLLRKISADAKEPEPPRHR